MFQLYKISLQKKTILLVFLLLLVFNFLNAQTAGFNNTFIILKTNGGANQYYDLNAATANPDFEGNNLGSFIGGTSNLTYVGAEHNVYKCGGCNISNTNLRYRIYPAGTPSGGYATDNILFTSDFTNGCSGADQLWSNVAGNVNLLSGLAPGNYVLEVFSEIITTCSGTLYASNGGANYKATFTVTPSVYVSATAATVGPTGYSYLSAAFSAINAGTHKGIIAVNIVENSTEIAIATLNNSGSAGSLYTSITINPTGDRTISSNLVGGLVDLNGADNVTIDGLNSGGNSLTFTNINTGNSSTIKLRADASNNIITRCQILGSAITSSSTVINTAAATVYFAAGLTTGNDNNTISFCNIADASAGTPLYAILSNTGNTAIFNDNLLIQNCNIYNYFNATKDHAGILMNRGGVDISITGNSFYQTVSRNITTALVQHNFIYFHGNSLTLPVVGGASINNNYFGGTSTACGGTPLTITGAGIIRGLYLNLINTPVSNIQSNTFQNISFTSNAISAANCFIDLVNGAINAGTTTGNTFGSMTGNGSIAVTLTANNNPPAQFAFVNLFTGAIGAAASEVNNNNFGSINFAKGTTTTANRVPIFKLINTKKTAYPDIKIKNNNIGSTTTANSIAANIDSDFSLINLEGTTASTATEISGNIINNCSNISTDSTASITCISVGSTTTSPVTISNNNIFYIKNRGEYLGSLSAVSYVSTIGILLYNASSASITNNTVKYFSNSGVGVSTSRISTIGIFNNSNSLSTTASTISFNIVSDFVSSSNYNSYIPSSPALAGIATASPLGNQIISNNKVFALELKSTVGNTSLSGIFVVSSITGANSRIFNNIIYGLKNLTDNQSAAKVTGLNVYAGGTTLANAPTYYNNMISLNNDNGNNDLQLQGIRDYSSTSASFNNYYFNSVNIYGLTSAANRTFAFLRDQKGNASTNSNVYLRNNVFHNIRKNTSASFNINLAIGCYSNGTAAANLGFNSDYNDIYTTNTNGYVGECGSSFATFANWKTISGGDVNAVSDTVTFVDIANGDLHLLSNNCVLDGAATPIAGITTDFDGVTKSTTLPDIGAIETTAIPPTAAITPNRGICSASPTTISIDMTGIPKWSLKYTINGGTPISVNYLTTTSYTFVVSPSTATTYALTNLKSGSCYVTSFATPTATISINPANTWIGVNTNWFDAANWCPAVPTATTDVTIPAGASNYPVIPSGNALARNVTVAVGASVQVTSTGKFTLYGTLTNNGTFDLSDGTLSLASTSAQTIAGNKFKYICIKNLIVGNSASLSSTLNDTLKIIGNLSFANVNNRTFTTNGNLTLVSNENGTASLNDLTNAGVNSGNTISGKVNIERYLFAQKSWRFLATPVDKRTSPTITEAWRESSNASSTGYGTQITGPATSVGMDQTSQRGSLKYYNAAVDTWVEITNTSNRLADSLGYMVFVRGDRAVTQYGLGATNLRIKGDVLMGNQVFPVPAGKYQSFGNPYPSRINFATVVKNNVSNAFTIWNPRAVGLYNVGGYETYTLAAGDYWLNGIVGGTKRNFIESGEAVFVQSNGGAGSITVREIDKALQSANVSRGAVQAKSAITIPTLDISLYTKNAQNNDELLDAVSLNFDDSFSEAIDNNDVRKITNPINNLSIKTANKLLVVEKRPAIVATDTIQLNLAGTSVANYEFELYPTLMNATNVEAFIVDRFLQTKAAVSLSQITNVNFAVTTEAASKAADRFIIVFKQTINTNFTAIAAKRNTDKTITVNWGVANEKNVVKYVVEQSNDGINFTDLSTQIALANNGTNLTYTKLDATASVANNWYRVKAVNTNGTEKYTSIAMVAAVKEDDINNETSIVINPNPIIGNTVNLSFIHQQKGKYIADVYSAVGQKLASSIVNVKSTVEQTAIQLSNLSKGNYHVIIIDEQGKKTTLPFLVN